MSNKSEVLILTSDEKRALEEYQDNYFIIINTLLRKGITSEQTINSKNGRDYIAPTNEELEKAINDICKIYSAIIKSTLAREDNKTTKPIYRGTQISLVEEIKENGEETSFLSTTTNKNQTRAFSRTFSKDKNIDSELDKALLKVEGDVPYINMEEAFGGLEDEILFAPAKAEIIEGIEGISSDDERHTKLYGKPYTLKLTSLEIPEMSKEDISRLRESIFDQNEKMGRVINNILQMKQYPEQFDTSRLPSLIQEYSRWKESIISYCHQEFREIKRQIENEYEQTNDKQSEKKVEKPSRNYIAQTDPEIKLSSSYINYTEFQRTDDGKTQTEKRKSPLLNEEKQVIGESEEIEVYDYETGITTRNRYETIEGENRVFSVDTKTVERGESFSVHSTMTVFNEVSKCKEKSEYIRDESGNETYAYMENGRIGQKITRTARGTTIDIFKDGQPYATYEYDENGKAIIPMGKMEQLPENYVECSFKAPIPEYSEISNQEPSKPTVDTQRLGKETLDMQKDTRRIDEVEQQMSEQMREQTMQENATVRINEFGEIIRTGNTQQSFRESMRFDVSSNEYAQETLRKFTQDLENGTLENVDSKKKDSHKVEKGDDDYVM